MVLNSHHIERKRKKEEAIRVAIREIHSKGGLDFSNKEILKKVQELYKDNPDKDYIVHEQLLYKSYYKENLSKWIKEETGLRNAQLKQSLQKAHEAKAAIAQSKYKQLQKDSFKVVENILKGNIECKKFTKSFLLGEVNKLYRNENNQNITDEYGQTTFSDEKYKQIFYDAQAKLTEKVIAGSSNESQKNVTALEYTRLKQENKRLNQMNKNLASKMFTVYEGDGHLLSANDTMYSQLMSIQLDADKLFKYLEWYEMHMEGQKVINAYQFVNLILENCKKAPNKK